jgi:type III restriction enzyme
VSLALKLYQRRALASLEKFFEASRLSGASDAFAAHVDEGLLDQYKPMPGQPDVPYVCLRIPTGGGKTVMGAHIIQVAGRALLDREFPLVMWMVPTTQIKTQTLDAFRDPRHPYRQELDDAFDGKVAVFDVADFAQIRPADIGTKVCVVISTVAALRVNDREGRKVYEHHEDLEPHFAGSTQQLDYLDKGADGKALASFANLLKLHGPLVIMDEAHNATTPLSYTVYERLGPKAVVELTATPDLASSNVLVSVSAFELKAENMIKFPVVLKEHNGEWQAAVSSAVARRKTLAKVALEEPEYIRPILLVQAESSNRAATVEEVKRHLMDTDGVDEKAIAIATGSQRELDGIDLFAKGCPIEVVITKQALKEGWDCSFAYVFCSVAQVRSDKDIQQLLGRVLRMPYASRRTQDAMNKAYAHVVSESFGQAAGELTQSLIDIGFNPMEAAAAIRRDAPVAALLPLEGGATSTRTLPTTCIEVRREPDFANVPARDAERVVFTPHADGSGGTLEITDEIDAETVEAIVATIPKRSVEERARVVALVERHHAVTAAAKAPSEHGAVFRVPRLYMVEQGELDLIDHGTVAPGFQWNLLDSPPDLASFRFSEESMTFEVDLDGRQGVSYHMVKDDAATYLPGFAQDRSETDLIGWLDHEIRDPSVKQPVLREWLRRAIRGLLEDRGFSLAQLLKGQFILRRKLVEQLQLAKERARAKGFQQALFEGGLEVIASDGPDHDFTYPADMARYPAHSYYPGRPYRFRKHYYPVPGDLKNAGEEFECARAIDLLDEVEFWVRNLVHPSQFWMPTSRQRTYPDFVAKLKDGRLFVIEYKGGDRYSSDSEKEKRLVGELWAHSSGGKGLYLMAQLSDERGRNVRAQLLATIADR